MLYRTDLSSEPDNMEPEYHQYCSVVRLTKTHKDKVDVKEHWKTPGFCTKLTIAAVKRLRKAAHSYKWDSLTRVAQ